MPKFDTTRQVSHTPQNMFELVADVEKYPQFLPLCEALDVKSRKERDGKTLLVADMTVGYKAIRETFTSQVLLDPNALTIEVQYLNGPFKYLNNLWTFESASSGCDVRASSPASSTARRTRPLSSASASCGSLSQARQDSMRSLTW